MENFSLALQKLGWHATHYTSDARSQAGNSYGRLDCSLMVVVDSERGGSLLYMEYIWRHHIIT